MKILSFQHQFLAAIKQDKDQVSQEILNDIVAIGELTPWQTIEIYRNDYYARLSEVLGELYETLWMILGDEQFNVLCRSYIEHHPSAFQNLSKYGAQMPSFLNTHELASEYPFITSVAQLELDYWQIFHRENSFKVAHWPDSQTQANPNLKLNLDANCKLVSSPFSVLDLFHHRTKSADTFKGDIFKSQHFLIYKIGDNVRTLELEEIQYRLLTHLASMNLSDALSSLETQGPVSEDQMSAVGELFVKLKHSQVNLEIT